MRFVPGTGYKVRLNEGETKGKQCMNPAVKAFFDEVTNTVTYVVSDAGSKTCAIIDPVLNFNQASGRTSTGSAGR